MGLFQRRAAVKCSALVSMKSSPMTWRTSKLRKVGLHEMVWGLGGRNAIKSMGCRGEAKSHLRGIKQRYVWHDDGWLNACCHHLLWGIERGSAAAPFSRGCGTTTHILRSSLWIEVKEAAMTTQQIVRDLERMGKQAAYIANGIERRAGQGILD